MGQFDDIISDMINEDDFIEPAPPGDAAQSDPTESFGEPGTHGRGSGSDTDPYGGRAPTNVAGADDPATSPPTDEDEPRGEDVSGDDDPPPSEPTA
jgi:hypothetical protein